MTHRAANLVVSDDQKNSRNKKLRGWTRMLTFVLAGLCLTAIWQEERLAPPVHDGMQQVAGIAMGYINQNETLSNALVELQEGYDKLVDGG